MGLLDSIAGGVPGGGSNEKLMSAVTGMLGDTSSGGVNGFVESFTKNGLGNVVSSWVGTGENKSISPEQVLKGLGQVKAQERAGRSGLSIEQLAPLLATMLPMIIDKLTPEGKVPEAPALQNALGGLGKLFR